MRRVIITGDDFGLARPVNEAIEIAHREGVLTAASLMVGAPETGDAVARALAMPSLKVGLHLVVVEGTPVLPPEQVPDLVDDQAQFSRHFVRTGFSFFFTPGIRQQLEAEIEAQFREFSRTGLPLDHVNSHTHMHLHPTVFRIILKVGRDYGMNAIRIPREPPVRSWRASGRHALLHRSLSSLSLLPLNLAMKVQLQIRGLRHNDYVFGLHDSGDMNEDRVLGMLHELPAGVSELYFHPATRRCAEIDDTMPDYRHEEELDVLTSSRIREALDGRGIARIAFSDI